MWKFAVLAAVAALSHGAVIPFVACDAGGQNEEQRPPMEADRNLSLSPPDAARLAYYKSWGVGILAPRGWDCYGLVGSSGFSLLVSKTRIDRKKLLSSAWDGISGPAIWIDLVDGDTSGRYTIAEMIGRVFPSFRGNAKKTLEDIGQAMPAGPYPADRLVRKNSKLVEFWTAANAEGLGTTSPILGKDPIPVRGVAMLTVKMNLVFAALRLSEDLSGLSPVIIRQVELDNRSW